MGQFLINPVKFLDNVYELDPQMRDRQGNPILQAIKQNPNWGARAYQRVLQLGLEPISMMDRWVAAIGWKATYDANLSNLGHDGAVREAQRAVALTQQIKLCMNDMKLICMILFRCRLCRCFYAILFQLVL